MEALFGSLGWKLFVEEFRGMRNAIGASFPTIKPELLLREQGRYEAMSQLINFEELIEHARKGAETDPEMENPEDVET